MDCGVVNVAVLERTLAEGTETETGLQHFAGVAGTNRRLSAEPPQAAATADP